MLKRFRKVVNAGSVDLRNLDGIDLEGQSVKEDGSGDKGKTTEERLKAHTSTKRKSWNTIFLISCALTIFNDPLFCYIGVIDTAKMCIHFNDKTALVYATIRLAVDLFYIIDLVVSCLGIRRKRQKIGKRLKACGTRIRNENIYIAVNSKRAREGKPFGARVQESLPYISRVLVALPVLEAFIFTYMSNISSVTIYTIIGIQYTLRVFHIYELLRQRPFLGSGTLRRLKPTLDFVPFILASHLFGAIWYLLAITRQEQCWNLNCENVLGKQCNNDFTTCGKPGSKFNITLMEQYCPTKEPDPKVFDFGIFLYAIQSNVTDSGSSIPLRASQSFWWALRNLSSFGSNLNSSIYPQEVIFCVVISISGMSLFLVYLNSKVEEKKEKANRLKMKENNLVSLSDIDLWLSKSDFPKGLLETTTKKYKEMREVIKENIHKLDGNKDFDVQKILSILPIRERRRVMYHLRLASLKKVPKFENMDEKVLREISEHLKPLVYAEDSYIFREGKPLGKMFFITQGTALTYTSGGGTSCGSSSSTQCLEKGDFYGGELLDWAFKFASFSELPVSTRTVISQEKVEGFVIRANDLKNVVSKFWWYFSKNFCEVEDSQMEEQRDQLAAASLQAAWRRNRSPRAKSPNHWSKFTVN